MSAELPELVPLDAPTLVEASAGTGKTYTITTYFVRAILELGLRPEQILVLTYTKAATAELRARSRKRIVQAITLLDGPTEEPDALHEIVAKAVEDLGRNEVESRLRKALGKMDQAAILTIHGFCQRLLQDHPLLFGIDFDFEVAEDQASMSSELATDFWAANLYDRPPWLLRALSKNSVDAGHLARLANVALMPGMEILGPEPCDAPDEAVRRSMALRRKAAELWFGNRDAVCEILLETKGLNRRSYNPKTIRKTWIPSLDAFFGDDRFNYPPACLPRLSQGSLIMNKNFEEPRHDFFEACADLNAAHEALLPMLEYAMFDVKMRFIEFAREAARRRRDETAVLTFDDLLTTVFAPLGPSGTDRSPVDRRTIADVISKAYPLALVDEFQDTDSVQYGIFRAIYGEGVAVYVGDPKQAIYAFRGADVFSYIEAAADVGDRKHTLRTNRRSDPGVVHAVNALFSLRDAPFVLDGIDFEPAIPHAQDNRSSLSPSMEVVFLEEEQLKGPLAELVAPIVANEIALLLESDAEIEGRAVRADDVAVLCRSNTQANQVTRALRALNIPTSLDGGSSVLQTEIASDLRAVLEAALMPGDSRAVRRALLTSLLGVTPAELVAMSDEAWSTWVSRFRDWNEAWHSYGVLRFVEDMLRSTHAEQRIASRPTARRELTDLFHLEELLLRGERERRRNPVALVQWFRRMSDGSGDVGELAQEELQQRPDAESGAVRICTIHKSKGLEYGIVYCPFTWGDAGLRGFDSTAVKFHDEHRRIKLDLGSPERDEHRSRSEREAMSDALRLLYVAVTRAKHRCTLFWGPASSWKSSALRYLLHGEEGFEALGEDELREAVTALAAGSNGAIEARPPHEAQASPLGVETPEAQLATRTLIRSFSHAARLASFTSLTGHDEKTPSPRTGPAPANAEPGLFASLPGGARTGLLLHSILEHSDFAKLDGVEAEEPIERQLRASGFDPTLVEEVRRDLGAVARTPLTANPDAPRLIDLPSNRQLRELEFTLRVDRPKLVDLAALMKQHGAPAAAPRYYERLAEVSSQTLQRFLRGYIDLMFEWQGRWYVADYKSNTLPTYAPEAVNEAVQREHYLLQAQLYTAAAHRYLKQRVQDYDPEIHWGGALFLFLRGMKGPEVGGSSVFFDRQPAELLRAVDDWLGGGNESH